MAATGKQPSKSATTNSTTVTDQFCDAVETALKHFNEPVWLGENSPLATPYFLDNAAEFYAQEANTAVRYGKALQQLLRQAADIVSERNARFGDLWRDLVQLRYFNTTTQSEQQIILDLNTSLAAYHRHRGAAIAEIANELIRLVKPALRIESPSTPAILVGRQTLLDSAMAVLQQGKAVMLSGPGGVGKTSLGATLVQTFAPQTSFWYTLTPGLNDSLNSITFALAWFLHGQGASTLWSQLVADKGEVKPTVALNLLRHDLTSLQEKRLLLCFDEIDLLRPSEIAAHTQLVPFLESLLELAPILFIGQKAIIGTHFHLTVPGLAEDEIEHMLNESGIALIPNEIATLQQHTLGNPRLLELFIAYYRLLYRQGVSVKEVFDTFAQQPALETLLRRIWLHLNETEKYLLELLAIFRSPVPRTVWNDHAQQSGIDQLIRWHLVQEDEQHTLRLLPAIRSAIAETLLAAEEKELLHLEAATIRSQYGQFSAAAWHFVNAGDNQSALQLLHQHKDEEIDQGQAETMLTILKSISQRTLKKEEQENLVLLRAELQKLLGNYDAARASLQSTYWSVPFLNAQRWRLEGDIAELRGETRRAQDAYRAGLETVEKSLGEAAYFHRDLGYLYTNDVDFERADYEIARMRHEVANLEGFRFEMSGDLPNAERAYQEALQLAREIRYPYGEANTQNNLGRIYGWQRQLSKAESEFQSAIDFFRNTGRLNKLASATYNLALARRLAKAYQSALSPAKEALLIFEQLEENYGCAVSLALLAESYLGLEDLAQAEHFAQRVIAAEQTSCLPDGLRTLGEAKLKTGDSRMAEQYIQQSLEIARHNQNQILEAYALRSMSEVYVKLGELNKSEEYLTLATTLFRKLGLDVEIEEYAKSPAIS